MVKNLNQLKKNQDKQQKNLLKNKKRKMRIMKKSKEKGSKKDGVKNLIESQKQKKYYQKMLKGV